MRGNFKVARIVLAAAFMFATIIYAVRVAIVEAYAESQPALAATVWKDHPEVIASMALVEVAQAASRGQPVQAQTESRLRVLAKISPLAPEPFLVLAANELKNGRVVQAEKLLHSARHRDPRSAAVRYLLSDLYLQQGRFDLALNQLSVLSRLLPSMAQPLAPAIARYAADAGPTPHLKKVLSDNPQLGSNVMAELASDYRNAELILTLIGTRVREDREPVWLPRLVLSLVEARDFKRAFAVWRRYAGNAGASQNFFHFEPSATSSPFSWELAQKASGYAEAAGGELRVRLAGTEDVVLATKVALMAPGRYAFGMRVTGEAPVGASVSWLVTCLPSEQRLLTLPLTSSTTIGAQLIVPANCEAQKFELKGVAQTYPEATEFTISNLEIKALPK
jgi:tetratricopeptide (TPR) repeat protein